MQFFSAATKCALEMAWCWQGEMTLGDARTAEPSASGRALCT